MSDKLKPAFIRVQYHSAKAPHVATIPIIDHSGGLVGEPGTMSVWGGGGVAADTAIEAFIDLWAAMVANTLTFDRYQIYRQADPPALPEWRFEKAYSVVGSATIAAGLTYSVQHTITFRSDNNGILKFTTMDRGSGGFFGRSYIPSSEEQDMIDFITGVDSFLMARDNGRPVSFLRLTVSQNDRLAREYHQSLS